MGNALLSKLSEFVAQGEEDKAVETVYAALEANIPPLTILNDGAAIGLDLVGEQYNNGEVFLPELVLAGDAMRAVMNIIMSQMSSEDAKKSKQGVVVIGQAKGDVHDIGKNIVAALLAVSGFEVHDLGIDVPVKTFIEKAEEHKANIIAISTLLTTSLPYLDDVIHYIQDTGARSKYFVIVGGGPVTPEFAAKIQADGWARNAFGCAELCKQLVQRGAPGKDTVAIEA